MLRSLTSGAGESRGAVSVRGDGGTPLYWCRRACASWLVAAGVVLLGPSGAGAATQTETFDYTGASQAWTVPVNVTAASFDLYGAQGGRYASTYQAGLGGRATVTIPVSAGQVYGVYVGGRGGGYVEGGGAGGYNGGPRVFKLMGEVALRTSASADLS